MLSAKLHLLRRHFIIHCSIFLKLVRYSSFRKLSGSPSTMGVRRKFAKEGNVDISLVLFQVANDATQMDLHETLYPFYTTKKIPYEHGRNEVRWRPVQEANLAPPCSKLGSCGSKCTALKKVLVTLLGLFGAPRNDLAPTWSLGARRIALPYSSLVTPLPMKARAPFALF